MKRPIDMEIIQILHEKHPEVLAHLFDQGVDKKQLMEKEWGFLQKNLDDKIDFMPEERSHPNVDGYTFKKSCKFCIIFEGRKIFVKPEHIEFDQPAVLGKTVAQAIAEELETLDELESLKYAFSVEIEEWKKHNSKTLTIYNGAYAQVKGAVKYVIERDGLIKRRSLSDTKKEEVKADNTNDET